MKISAIICAAGKGERAGLGRNKVLAPLFGQPVIYTATEKFFGLADEIIVAATNEDLQELSNVLTPFGVIFTQGGKTRSESVYNALKKATGDIVLVHDGARPFVSRALIERCIEEVTKYGSAVCAVPATDTVANVESGEIISVPDRDGLYLLQTPQCFKTRELLAAYDLALIGGKSFSDDSSVFLNFIGRPHITEGETGNIKLTYKSQFDGQYPAVNAILPRAVGMASDVHAFKNIPGEITLCGVKIAHEKTLVAHSDGDVPVHALMDALLSAAGLKDIGHYFPTDDIKYLGADSMLLLEKVVELVAQMGLAPLNASVAIQAEEPRLAPHIRAMKQNIMRALKLEEECVGITAGTSEGLGFIGNGLGISASAAVLLKVKHDG